MEIKEALEILKGMCPNGFALVPLISNEKEALLTAISHLETLQKVKESGGVKRKEIYENNYSNGWNDCLDAVHAELVGKLDGLTPEKLHASYLEAIRKLTPQSYNPNAKKEYKDLTVEQKSIDMYICQAIQDLLLGKKEE